MDVIDYLSYEELKDLYFKTFKSFPPFKWIDWKSKFNTESELLKYCLINGKQWFEIVEPIEEGVRINYKKE